MLKILILFSLFFNILFASSLESLLKDYEDTSKQSLETLNEKMGHVVSYSKKELELMQYDKLSDILQELPSNTLKRSTLGSNNLSLTGTGTDASGFFRLYINDHEVSSAYTQTAFQNWYDLPVSLIDHVEIYYGEGSFSLGNETGMQFIRVYTKKASIENGGNFKTTINNKSSNSQEFSYSSVLDNDWSYFLYFANQKDKYKSNYNGDLNHDSIQKYFFFDVQNFNNEIHLGYSSAKKDIFEGLSLDGNSDNGEINTKNFYLDYTRYFLDDKSLKLKLSTDILDSDYWEENSEGILLSGWENYFTLGWAGHGIQEYDEDIQLIKKNVSLSKTFKTSKNKIFTSINLKNTQYKTKSRNINSSTYIGTLSNFDEETSYSFAFQDDYSILDNLLLTGNFKIEKYIRNGELDNTIQKLYRVGTIFLPTKNLGFKTFYTISHLPPSFYNVDYTNNVNDTLESQKYKYFTTEGTYTFGKSKVNLAYYNVHIDNFIYNTQYVGFVNVDHTIKINGYIFDYVYNIDKNSKVKLNYFLSDLTEVKNNYTDGGYIKYMHDFGKFSYFTSLIYRKGFEYLDQDFRDSYNLNVGAKYNIKKNLSVSVKGTNLLNKPTQSLIKNYTTSFTNPDLYLINNYDRAISFSLEWSF